MPLVVQAEDMLCNATEEESSVRNYTFSVVALREGKKPQSHTVLGVV